jgi:hypothetical protein
VARSRIPVLACSLLLLAPTIAFAQMQRLAQADVGTQSYDPLAPDATDDSTQKKPRPYQTFERKPPDRRETTTFEAPRPAAGAGKTGFDSTNSRGRKTTSRSKKSQAADSARDIAPGDPAPAPLSVKPPAPTNAGQSAYAQAGKPGAPPIEVGNQPPTRIKKKKKKEELDPYDPLGMRSGGLIYYPAVELIGGYDSNPARTSGGKGASTITVAPELRVRSDWERHEFKADLRGSYNWFSPDSTPSLDRPYFNGTANGRIDVTRDTRIDLEGRTTVSTDNPNSPNLPAGLAKLPLYTSFGGTAGVGQKFNRLDVSLKGTVDRTVYQDSELTNGATASNEDRNYNQYGGLLRTGYEIGPGVTPFFEVGGDTRKHDLAVDSSGYKRDSTGWTAMAGSTFELTRLLTGDIAIGYTQREYEDARLKALAGFIGKGSLTWTASALTTVKLTAATTVGESDQAGVSGVLYRDVGLEVDHAFRRWLIGSLKGGAGFDDYVGGNRNDQRYYFGAGLTYKLNRFTQIKGEARHEWLTSSQSANDYSANVVMLSLRLQY